CCLEGLSQEEVAARLVWTPGSVKGRLERGRRMLHERLTRRGLTLAAVLMAVEVSRSNAAVGTAARTASALRAARPALAGAPGIEGDVSTRVRLLAEEGARRMTSAKVMAGVGVLFLGLVTTGAVTLAARGAGEGQG